MKSRNRLKTKTVQMPTPGNRSGGSFRDPEGHVYCAANRIFRGIARTAEDRIRSFLRSDFFLQRAGKQIVNCREIDADEVIDAGIAPSEARSWRLWVEHDRVPLVTYPYEWPFDSLRCAASFTLSVLRDALDAGYMLKDASAFNVQFIDGRPIFIDLLSFVEYENDSPFIGYKQFCEHFFAPLCLTAFLGIPHNHWFKGRLDGLDLVEVSRGLPLSTRLRPQVLMHIHAQAWALRRLDSGCAEKQSVRLGRRIPKRNLMALCGSLHGFISRMRIKGKFGTYWQNYAGKGMLETAYGRHKLDVAQEFIQRTSTQSLLDLGCNTGEFSKAALDAGCRLVVGVDSDAGALNLAAERARNQGWPAYFLYFDLANPSPDTGWLHQERVRLEQRIGRIDAVFCFALIHHLAIGRNLPVAECIGWLCSLAPRGLIEFIPKSDPMVQGLLKEREDVFDQYGEASFVRSLELHAAIVRSTKLASSERTVYEYATNAGEEHVQA